MSAKRTVAGLVSVVVGFAGALVVAPDAAHATNQRALRPTSWVYTDSRTPGKGYVNQGTDAPIGAWKDTNGKHKSRSYFTYDIRQYKGQRIVSTGFVVAETQANDCRKPRSWQLWTTDPVASNTSWNRPPRERTKVADVGGTVCPSGYIGVDLGNVVRDALAAGRTTLTLELRVPERLENDPRYGRRIANDPALIIKANATPGLPTQLTVDGRSCDGDEPLYTTTTTPTLNALLTDPDVNDTGGGDIAYGTFAVWPVDHPEARVELPEVWAGYAPARAWSGIPGGILQDGVTYAVAARGRDDADVSPWSEECRFTVDTTRPGQAPVVSSTDYPSDNQQHGGPGIPGTVTFSANGVSDVVGYAYGEGNTQQYVAAPTLGGSASIQFAPSRAGIVFLNVRSIDRAGNSSDEVTYRIWVRSTAPAIEDADPDAWLGDTHHLTLRPNLPGTVSYTYQLDDAPAQTVAAAADGTAQVQITPTVSGTVFTVFGTTAAGVKSGTGSLWLLINSRPFVESAEWPFDGSQGKPVGTPGSFTIKPHMHGVVEYVVQFNQYQENEQPPQTIPAGPDGSITVPYTPTSASGNSITVISRTADGTESEEAGWAFYPASIAPVVSSADYPLGDPDGGGGPGVEGAFQFRPTAANVVSYQYVFGSEPQQTVAAGADGTATVHWTPQQYDTSFGGWVSLRVRTTSADGLVSDWAYVSFRVKGLEPTVESDVYHWPDGGTVGQTASFTFTAHLGGSTQFVYSFDGAPEQTVAVGSDGKATVTWTPESAYSHSLSVRSRTAAGLYSGYAYLSLWVNPS
ncbi:hypothetical protein ACQP2P_40590 [Dactylosporangium sp. CA-139114]|uniref:hypothetical protein n=1 Tax=Dactylosporangium sp. CA-139114 TaxID=3239931 RepID=UPI003D98149C